jgi:tetratricopeptide (TPR) repeat protein
MEAKAGAGRKLPLLILLGTLGLYGFLVFSFFPPTQFHKYVLAARQAIEGTLSGERYADFSPLYLLFHILAQKALKQPVLFFKLAQVVWASLSPLFLFLALKKLVRPAVAAIGAAALIFNPALIVMTQAFEPETLGLFLSLGFLFFALREDWPSHLLGGVFAGLAFLTRPNILPVLAFVPVFFFIRPSRSRAWKLISVLCFSAPVILSLLFLVGRNDRLLGRPTLVTMNPGTVFYEGNNPLSQGTTAVYPFLVYDLAREYTQTPDVQHVLYRRLARWSAGKNLTVSEVNAYWRQKALRFIRDNPRRSARLLATKVFHLFHSYDWHDLYNAYWNGRKLARSAWPIVPLGVISALALLGMAVQWKRWRQALLFYSLFAGQAAVMVVFYVSARQRLILLPALLFFACAALDFLVTRKRGWLLLAAVIPLSIVLVVPTSLMREEDHLWQGVRASSDHLNEAYRQRQAGDYPEAEIRSALALAAAPWLKDSLRPSDLGFEPAGFAGAALGHLKPESPSASFDEAVLLLEAGKTEEAEAAWRALLRKGPGFKRDYYQSSSPHYYLALTSLRRGDRDSSRRLLLEALRSFPGDPSILAALAILTGEEHYSRTLAAYLDDASVDLYLGKAFLLAGDAPQAVPFLTRVVEGLPDYRPAKIYLAAAAGLAGDGETAASLYIGLIGERPDPVLLEEPLLEVFKGRSEKAPSDVRALLEYGIVLRQFGRTKEALAVLERAKVLADEEWTDPVARETRHVERILAAHRPPSG